jgi:hypothetical protein
MAEDVGIQIRIESSADVASVDNAAGSLQKVTTSSDALEESLNRTKQAFAEYDERAKAADESTKATGASMDGPLIGGASRAVPVVAALTAAAGVAIASFKAWMAQNEDLGKSLDNLKDAANGALAGIAGAVLGDGAVMTDWIDEVTLMLGGQTEKTKEWGRTTQEMAKLQADSVKEAGEIVKKSLEEQNDLYDTAIQKVKDLAEANRADLADAQRQNQNAANEQKAEIEADPNLNEKEKKEAIAAIDRKLRDDNREAANAAAQSRKDEAEDIALIAEQNAAKAAADDKAQDEKVKKLERIKNLEAAADVAKANAAQNKADAERVENFPATARLAGLDPEEEARKSRAAAADDEQRAKDMQAKADEERRGVGKAGSLDSEKEKAEETEKNRLKQQQDAEKARREADKVANQEDRGIAARNDDAKSRDRIEQTRERGANAKEGNQAEAKEAAADAKEAAGAVKEGTGALEAGLQVLADSVKGQGEMGKQWAAELEKMAEGLKDGASTEELARIKAAMEAVTKSSNAAFADMGKTVASLADSTEKSAKIASEAMKRAKALEAKINALKS